jgi:hypothetical protein
MIKQGGIICIVLSLVSLGLNAEEIPFVEYKSLDPEIDLLSDKDVDNIERKLLLFPPLASFSRTEYAYIYDVAKNTAVKIPSEEAGLFPYTRITYFWDPHTRTNYGYVRPFPENEVSGWYTFALEDNDRLTLLLQNKDEYWASRSQPRINISDSKILVSNYSGHIQGRSPEHTHDSKFDIINIGTNERIWSYSITHSIPVDLYWISGSWLLNVSTPHIAGIWKTDTISNYETNEEVSFAPESIIGYGDGIILTSLQTEDGFVGITAWNTDKEILYRDRNFSITAMIYNYSTGKPSIYFSYYDYPYIYCSIAKMYNTGGPFITLIINLRDKKTYISPEGYHLHGIFMERAMNY